MQGVAKLNFPRLKTAATMRSLLIISCVVAAVFNRGKFSSATPSVIFFGIRSLRSLMTLGYCLFIYLVSVRRRIVEMSSR